MTEDNKDETTKSIPGRSPRLRKGVVRLLIVVGIVLCLVAAYGGYIFASSPAVIRNPKLEHYHFRMQVLVNGKAENFAEEKYQKGYIKDQCNANLPEQPIHFHDNKDQFTHIHWEGMTGGMVMKYYGWNYIGGIDNALGYKLDDIGDVQKVTTHGNYLPQIPKDANFYVYTGDEKGYKARSFNDWKSHDLEEFFGTTSNSPAHDINKNGDKQASLMNQLFPTAYAHDGEDDSKIDNGSETEEQKLTRINNLLGNVVIFVQNDRPTDQQLKDRFNDLEPLSDSTCGG